MNGDRHCRYVFSSRVLDRIASWKVEQEMTDTDKLKRLAGELKAAHEYDKRYYEPNRLTKKAYEAILALIAENERLGKGWDDASEQASLWIEAHDRVKAQRDEAVALLRGCVGADCESTLRDYDISAILARIDAAE